jgi:hypothetical protein
MRGDQLDIEITRQIGAERPRPRKADQHMHDKDQRRTDAIALK